MQRQYSREADLSKHSTPQTKVIVQFVLVFVWLLIVWKPIYWFVITSSRRTLTQIRMSFFCGFAVNYEFCDWNFGVVSYYHYTLSLVKKPKKKKQQHTEEYILSLMRSCYYAHGCRFLSIFFLLLLLLLLLYVFRFTLLSSISVRSFIRTRWIVVVLFMCFPCFRMHVRWSAHVFVSE